MKKKVLFTVFIIILGGGIYLLSQIIYTPNYCSGDISCVSQGECEMLSTGACNARRYNKTHCPNSSKRCVYIPQYNGNCREITSAVNLCEDYCESHFLISCNCVSRKGSGGCFGVRDCENY